MIKYNENKRLTLSILPPSIKTNLSSLWKCKKRLVLGRETGLAMDSIRNGCSSLRICQDTTGQLELVPGLGNDKVKSCHYQRSNSASFLH